MHYEGVLPDTWDYDTHDDGGHVFSFFWQPLDAPLNDKWNRMYSDAFEYIKKAVS
jgi:hypothetical protein